MVKNIVQKKISFSINIRVRTVSAHPMSSWNILQCKWNDSSEKLRCGHAFHSHKRQQRRFVHHLSRMFRLSRSINNSHSVRCGHVQQCRRLENPVHGLPSGQVLSGSVSLGTYNPISNAFALTACLKCRTGRGADWVFPQ